MNHGRLIVGITLAAALASITVVSFDLVSLGQAP